MDRTDQPHLLHAVGETPTDSRDLSTPTGMIRVGVEERHLAAGERATISGAAAAEGFVYVLEGRGIAACAGESQTIGPGDCLALSPGETLSVENPHTGPLALIVAFSAGGTGNHQREP